MKKYIFCFLLMCNADMSGVALADVPGVDMPDLEALLQGMQGGVGDSSWSFVYDELVLKPYYFSHVAAIPAGLCALRGAYEFCTVPSKLGEQNTVSGWLSRFLSIKGEGFSLGTIFSFMVTMGLIAGAYEISKHGVRWLFSWYYLNAFLNAWPKNRQKSPKELLAFFDREYELYKKEGGAYRWNTSRIVEVVSAAYIVQKHKIDLLTK